MVCKNKKRGCVKITIVLISCGLIVALLAYSLDAQSLDVLRHNLSIWTIISLILLINVVSFMCFTIMYGVFKWIKKDFAAPDDGSGENNKE